MRTVLIAMLLLTACALQAQELDIFDANDFVDPRDLGATITPRGGIACPCKRFLISQLFAGGATNYVDLLRTTDADVMFAHLATSYYTGRWQLNFKTSHIEELTNRPISGAFTETPHRKHTLQLGRYYTFGNAGGEPTMLRAQVTWSKVEYRRLVPRRETDPANYTTVYSSELGVEVDVRVRRLTGSFVYVDHRPASVALRGPPDHRKRLSFIHRLPRYSLGNFAIDASVAAGAFFYRPDQTSQSSPEPRNTLSRITVFPTLEIMSPTIRTLDVRVHLRYEPSVQQIDGPRGQGKRWQSTHQIGIFIDRPIFVKAF